MSLSRPAWQLSDSVPAQWSEVVASGGGGFFHSLPGLSAGAPGGSALYATLADGGTHSGAALGILTRCRLSMTPRHAYFPSLPLLAPNVDPAEAMSGLVAELKSRGVVDIIFDSFDAAWTPSASSAGRLGRPRREYLVDIVESPDAMKATFGQTHRRHVQRGEKSGWEFATVEGSEAGRIMDAVQGSAADRAARREDRFEIGGSADLLPHISTGPLGPGGVRVFVAREGGVVLSAALVGWNGRRAFYVLGGSTPEGYKASASVWLHWKIMQALWGAGVRLYNFGGTPAEAGDPSHPAHGLHRFKTGFSPHEEVRYGLSFELGTVHHLGHRLMGRLMQLTARTPGAPES